MHGTTINRLANYIEQGSAMIMTATRWPLNTDNRIQAQANPLRVSSGLSIIGTGYSTSNLLYISFNPLSTKLYVSFKDSVRTAQ